MDKYVIGWANPYDDTLSWLAIWETPDGRRIHIQTARFSSAYVFKTFEKAERIYNLAPIKNRAVTIGKPFIKKYTNKEYFKEKLRRG